MDKKRIAGFFRRFPLLGAVGQRVYQFSQAHYTVGAVAVVMDGPGQVLLLEHVYHPIHPWGLPGGWVNRRENPADAVVRELWEETGLHVTVLYPLLTAIGIYPNHLDIAYACTVDGGDIRLSDEILSYAWVDPAELPPMYRFQQESVAQAVRLRESAR